MDNMERMNIPTDAERRTPGARFPNTGMVRQGVVTNADNGKRTAKVRFLDTGEASDWLYVLASPPFIPSYTGEQRTEYESGGGGEAAFASHKHPLKILPWMPKVNERVLCLFDATENGFVLGRIG